jgi:hypothetical protein
MAIISIPTSIGGVSIPGAAISGPLGALYGNKFGRTDLQYPRDLQSATKGHYVQFTISEIKPATFNEVTNKLIGAAKSAATGVIDAITSPSETLNSLQKFREDPNSILKSVQFTQPELKTVGTISLYIPETVNFTYAAQYDKLSLATAAQQTPIIGKAAKTVLGAINSGPAKLLLRGQGYAFNPQQQILFEGIDFRTYQMAFTFTPYSKQEAATVEKIIKLFKVHAAPRLATGSAGMFFVPPSIFTPKFFFNGQENKKINKITKSVIENIDVNYAPNGFTTQSDGAPTQIQLTINFKEIELLTRDRIEQGY